MASKMRISTNYSGLHYSLASDLPDGVTITSRAPMLKKGFDVGIQVNIDIAVDLAEIAAGAFACWLANRIASASAKRHIDVEINGKQFPKNESEAVQLITHEVQSKTREENEDN